MAERRVLRPRVRRGLIAAGALALAAGAGYGSTYTWLFAAGTVRVEGESRMTAAEVRRIGGLGVGTNLFHLDASAIEHRLLDDPRVAEASVETDLPDVVTVRIVERVPVARASVAGAAAIVADDGELLPGTPSSSLPEIRAVAGVLDRPRRVAAAGALAEMSPALRRSVVTVFSAADGHLVLETANGVTVTYGAPAETAAKATSLRAVLAWADTQGVDLVAVDVSVPNAPTARTEDGSVTPTSP